MSKLASLVVKKLLDANKTLAVAESCTGGKISAEITDISGASQVFYGGFITYSCEMKMVSLGVNAETLRQYGAVSAQCAIEMARGVKANTPADITLAITGLAGPNGDEFSNEVGLVYIAICNGTIEIIEKFNFNGNREEIREAGVYAALNLINELEL